MQALTAENADLRQQLALAQARGEAFKREVERLRALDRRDQGERADSVKHLAQTVPSP